MEKPLVAGETVQPTRGYRVYKSRPNQKNHKVQISNWIAVRVCGFETPRTCEGRTGGKAGVKAAARLTTNKMNCEAKLIMSSKLQKLASAIWPLTFCVVLPWIVFKIAKEKRAAYK
jgi:hypothetical protein